MRLSFKLLDIQALLPGCQDEQQLQEWARGALLPQRDTPLPRPRSIPLMQMRRMDGGCRLAVGLSLSLWQVHQGIEAAVFCSRHGELQRNYSVLQALATGGAVSPTDFAMSVHNAAAGSFTIAAAAAIPVTALSAGVDSFAQALLETQALFAQGMQRVLVTGYETQLPDAYLRVLPPECRAVTWAHAVALLLAPGCDVTVDFSAQSLQQSTDSGLPQQLQFLRAYLLRQACFALAGPGRLRICRVSSWLGE